MMSFFSVSLKVVKAPSKFACQLSILKMMQSLVKLFSIELARNTHPLLLKTVKVVFVYARRERERSFDDATCNSDKSVCDSFFSGGVLSLKPPLAMD
jgi:hypothetical protein